MVTLFDNETILKGYIREKVNAAQAEALAVGERRMAVEIVKRMLKEALPIDLISELSGLTPAEINAIKTQMES